MKSSNNKSSNSSTPNEVCNIASGTVIKGNISTKANIRLEGNIQGNINCTGRLFIGQTGNIEGNVGAESITIEGQLTGDLNIQKEAYLKETCNLKGNITTKILKADQGAVFNGKCTMDKK